MQCVSCCTVVGLQGQELGAAVCWQHPVHMEIIGPQGQPPAGLNTELMVCSSGRM